MDVRLITLFSDAGHDAKTVFEEGLSGHPDSEIYSVSIAEKRILITQDMDFSNPFRFPPIPSEGILQLPIFSENLFLDFAQDSNQTDQTDQID